MKYAITEEDKAAILQHEIKYGFQIIVKDKDNNILDIIKDFNISNFAIDGESSLRRTLSIVINKKKDVMKYINDSLAYTYTFKIGVYSLRKQDYLWYDCGTYVSTSADSSYSAVDNYISLGMGDRYAQLDGTRNGQVGGAPTISIPNKDEQGNLVTIQGTFINFVKSEGITNFIIEEIGEFYGIQSMNADGYQEYRTNNPDWNKMPYDLEFNAGCNDSDIIAEIVNLYPNVQAYYDVFDNFCVNMIPSCNNHPVELDNDFLQKVLLSDGSEGVSYDIGEIRNITEVFGKIYDINYFSTSCTTSSNTYNITLENYGAYQAYEYIAFTPNTSSISNMKLKINSLATIPIYQEYTKTSILPNTILKGEMCVVRIMRDAGTSGYIAYYLGKYQPHALCVLTDDINDTKYTKEYFKNKYNCKNITLREEKGSPFTIQKIGEVLDVKSGEEYENILSDSVAMQNAIYQNQKATSMNETINITTKMIPWIDVQCKVEYRKAQEDNTEQYIIQSISHNIDSMTTTITMRKFYPLYYI